jgi:hypothetical protein
VLHTAGINTHVIADQFFPEAMAGGVVVLELFGGMCAGLEMLLRNGVKVLKYLYCDKNDTVRRVAAHRLHQLSAQYPALLSPESFYYAFTAFPAQDVWRISTTELIHAGVLNGDQWMIVAGWECQDLSPAGSGKGIFGDHSSTFFAMRHVIGAVQQLQPHKPPAYFIENTYMAFDFGKVVRTMPQNIDVICNSIGHPVACDAAQFDSYAHRMRHYWTNLAHTEHLQMLLKHVHRSPGLLVSDVVLPGRICLPVETADRKPFYKCNVKGAARSAFPTFVAFQGSRAFVANAPGAVYDGDTRRWTEPCPDEREVSMGYDRGCTRVDDCAGQPCVTEKVRHEVTGRAMDQNAVSGLMAMCVALFRCQQQVKEPPLPAAQSVSLPSDPRCMASQVHHASCCFVHTLPDGADYCWGQDFSGTTVSDASPASYNDTLMCMAVAEEQVLCATHRRDVWCDPALLTFVQKGVVTDGMSTAQLYRLQQRARMYQCRVFDHDDGQTCVIYRVMSDGTTRVVPPPDLRVGIIKQMHEKCGHFGEKRTVHLVLSHYWWYGLYTEVCKFVKECELCRRVNLSFNARSPELQPLPIMGMFYRWGVDLCGPFLTSTLGNKYVMVCTEYFSKHVELICIPDKTPVQTANAFLSHVLSRFGACAEVVSDQGSEWKSEFDALLESCYIDHRVAAPQHPECNGLTERVVQTLKNALRKYCEDKRNVYAWDAGVYWIALGYRCSPQASTKMSPYQLLYARRPTVPPAIVQRLQDSEIDFDCIEIAGGPGIAGRCTAG